MSTPPIVPPSDYTQAPTAEQFLADFPRFDTSAAEAPAVLFTEDAIAYWLQFAKQSLNADRLGSWYYTAVELFMAHNLALEAWAEQGGDQTIPGITKGAIAATASGDVSVAYNNAAVLELDAGHWNFTTYGLRFIRMIRLVSAGPLQVTGGGCAGPFSGPAWQGVWNFNFPNPSQ